MKINNIKLPEEIENIIFSFIFNTKSYLNCRLVCRKWYNKLKDGKTFNFNKLDKIFKFNNNNITVYNKNNQLVKEVIFKNYGDYLINTYTYSYNKKRLLHRINHTAPNKTEKINFQGEVIFCKTIFDIKNETIKNINYPMYPCSIS